MESSDELTKEKAENNNIKIKDKFEQIKSGCILQKLLGIHQKSISEYYKT